MQVVNERSECVGIGRVREMKGKSINAHLRKRGKDCSSFMSLFITIESI